MQSRSGRNICMGEGIIREYLIIHGKVMSYITGRALE